MSAIFLKSSILSHHDIIADAFGVTIQIRVLVNHEDGVQVGKNRIRVGPVEAQAAAKDSIDSIMLPTMVGTPRLSAKSLIFWLQTSRPSSSA